MIVTGSQTIVFNDVLVGEVWLCAGQSNMEKPLGERRGQKPTINYKEELAAANYPQIRLLQTPISRPTIPKFDFDPTIKTGEHPSCEWTPCSPESLTLLQYSATAYFFARKLFQQLNVPIGIINCSAGGSRIEPWTTPEGFASMPSLSDFAKAANTPGVKVEGAEISTLYKA